MDTNSQKALQNGRSAEALTPALAGNGFYATNAAASQDNGGTAASSLQVGKKPFPCIIV